MRTLEHDALYSAQVSKLGDVKRLDEMLENIHDAIAINAEAFDIVPGTEKLRIARTRRFSWASDVPHITIWFTIEDENRVRLRSVDHDVWSDTDDEF